MSVEREGARIPGREATERPKPRRFYKEALAAPCIGGFRVLLDGRAARTPRRQELIVPHEPVAAAIAAEWSSQGERSDPSTMSATTLACTAIDGVSGNEPAVAAEVARYAGSDLLCYRADMPEGLVALQRRHWDPPLAWIARALGARFVLSTGIAHVAQPQPATQAIEQRLANLDAFSLAAIHVLTTLTGSAILALAVLERHMTLDDAWTAAHVDEDWQISKWGEDAEARERRRRRRMEAGTAALFLSASGVKG